MELGDLSEDVLALIFEFESGSHSIAPLHAWKTGNRKLRSKMANGGITAVKLMRPDLKEEFRVPQCIEQWKLSYFCIHAHPLSQFAPKSPPLDRLLRLSSANLRTLDLTFANTANLLFPSTTKLGQKKPSSKHKPSSSSTPTSAQSSVAGLNSTQLQDTPFPRLETLRINCRVSMDIMRFFALLPRSLTILEVSCLDGFPVIINSFADLPPTLKQLSLPEKAVINELTLKTLPTPNGIEAFNVPLTENGFTLLVRDHATLLPRLIDFPISQAKNWYTELGFDNFELANPPQFPHNMRYINFDDRLVNPRIPLPIGLASLTTHWGTLSRAQLTSWIPKSLTNLSVGNLHWPEIEAKDWPPTLTQLYCRQLFFPYADVERLPRTLRGLQGCSFGDDEERANLDIPAALSTGRRVLSDSEIDQRLWSEAKAELRVRSASSEFETQILIERYITSVEDGGLFGLPIGLIHVSAMVLPNVVPPRVQSLAGHLDEPQLEALGVRANNFFELLPPSLRVYGSPEFVAFANRFVRS